LISVAVTQCSISWCNWIICC